MATTASCLAEELPAGTVIQIERPDVRQKRLYHLVKRVFDAVCALLGLLALLWTGCYSLVAVALLRSATEVVLCGIRMLYIRKNIHAFADRGGSAE